jgi:glutamine amidotransferase
MIIIIDYGVGNLGSIKNMLKRAGVDSTISSDRGHIEKAHKLILPGIGSFDYGMKKLIECGLADILNKKVLEEKIPILGICLGAQLFTKRSEEGKLNGLGWLDAETVKFNFDNSKSGLKIPHMGWSEVSPVKKSLLFKDMYEEPRFYFVHSYHIRPNNEADVITKTKYGYEFVSAIEKENIIGVQFHPEKSHKFGIKLLKNFVELY